MKTKLTHKIILHKNILTKKKNILKVSKKKKRYEDKINSVDSNKNHNGITNIAYEMKK